MAITKLLLPFDGADESQDINDLSTYDHSITVLSNCQKDTAQKVWGTASGLFQGTDDGLRLADSACWDIFSWADATIELQVRFSNADNNQWLVGQQQDDGHLWSLLYGGHPEHVLYFRIFDAPAYPLVCSAAWDPPLNTWFWVVLAKKGNKYGLYINGTQIGYADDASVCNYTGELGIGIREHAMANEFIGHMDDLRIADYNIYGADPNVGLTDTITPPTHAIFQFMACTSDGQSTAIAGTKVARKVAGTADGQATAGAAVKVTRKVAGTSDGQSTAACAVKVLRKVAGTSDGQSTASCTASIIVYIACTSDAQSTAVCTVTIFVLVVGSSDGQSTAVCATKVLRKVIGSAAGQSTASCTVYEHTYIVCTAAGQSTAVMTALIIYAEIPPFMEKDLIDPYESGAWLWLAEIAVPTQATQRIARNTADVNYRGYTFSKFNLQIGEQIFSGDGSIPRVTLRVFQDVNRTMEDIINATEGALGAQVKLIRVNEKYLDSPVSALEFDYDALASESDSEWSTFTLGIPNPLMQRFPLRIYSSSSCPSATPTLYKGPECQCVHADTTCTGTYEDCYGKGNAVHWGAELGLDPNTMRV